VHPAARVALTAAPTMNLKEALESIRPFAWPLLLQAGGLAKIDGTRLALTPAGNKARPDFYDAWGTDDLALLSRYDGLRYIRLNALGAYCLVCVPESRLAAFRKGLAKLGLVLPETERG
jgi:hypothetical protein